MDKMRFNKNSIYKNGYGIIAKKIMTDTRLHIESKAIYSYLVSYAGAGESAFPGVDLILHHLKISKTRFYKYRDELIKYGYIQVVKEKSAKGKFSHSVYIIMAEPCPQIEYTGNEDTEFEDTNNNSLNNNNNNSNRKNIYVTLQDDGCSPFLGIYLSEFERCFSKCHMRVTEEQREYINLSLGIIDSFGVDTEEFKEQVKEHFENLPANNNGNILAFLKASFRYFNIDLDRAM